MNNFKSKTLNDTFTRKKERKKERKKKCTPNENTNKIIYNTILFSSNYRIKRFNPSLHRRTGTNDKSLFSKDYSYRSYHQQHNCYFF